MLRMSGSVFTSLKISGSIIRKKLSKLRYYNHYRNLISYYHNYFPLLHIQRTIKNKKLLYYEIGYRRSVVQSI